MMSDLNMFHGKNVWLCFISIIFVHFCHKTEKYLFSNSLKYFNFFYQRKWLQIWVCPIKHCLIWFKRRCLRLILAISWEVRILNFLDVVYYFSSKESVVRSKCVSFSFFLFCFLFFVFYLYFCHYYRIIFQLKKFLVILRYIEKLQWKICV